MVARVSFRPDPDLPPLAQAASLALAIMRKAKVACWNDLDQLVPWEVDLLDGQLELLRDHLTEIGYLSMSRTLADGTKVDGVTMCLCPSCLVWQLLAGSPAPKRCQMTSGCTGAPIRVSAAPRCEKPAAPEPAPDALPGPDTGRPGGTQAEPDGPQEEPARDHPAFEPPPFRWDEPADETRYDLEVW